MVKYNVQAWNPIQYPAFCFNSIARQGIRKNEILWSDLSILKSMFLLSCVSNTAQFKYTNGNFPKNLS